MLRRFITGIFTTGLLAGVVTSCTSKNATELVAGVHTQVQVPRDMKVIRVDVAYGGSTIFCNAYRVYDGRVQLPKSLGSVPTGEIGQSITFTVTGFTEESPDVVSAACNLRAAQVGKDDARILRRSRQPYVGQKILYVPIPLRFACYDKDCDATGNTDSTCKAGQCVSAGVDEKKLPVYSDDLLYGTTRSCFSLDACFKVSTPPITVDEASCVYALPGATGAPKLPPQIPAFPKTGDGLNVRVIYDGGFNREILDIDPDEGFTIPDPAKPQIFKLAPGLCELVHGVDAKGVDTAHRISGIEVSGFCNPKTPYQPICEGDLNAIQTGTATGVASTATTPKACASRELKISPNALVVLIEKTKDMDKFFSQTAVQTTLGLSLNDPAFRTTKIGMRFVPTGTAEEACAAGTADLADLTVKFDFASVVRGKIADELKKLSLDPSLVAPAGTATKIDNAFLRAYSQLRQLGPAAAFNKRAVLLLGTKDFSSKCVGNPATPDIARAARDATASGAPDPISTYAVLFGNTPTPPAPDTNLALADQIAKSGSVDPAATVFDARTSETKGFDAFYKVVGDLGACVYEQPKAPLPAIADNDIVQYYDPTQLKTVTVTRNTACTDEKSVVDGWGKENGRIRICGAPCTQLRSALKNSGAISAAQGFTAPAIPIFAVQSCK